MQPLCTRGSPAVAKSMGPSVSGAGPLRRRDIPVVTQSPCGRYVSTRGRRRRHRFFETASRRFLDMWHQSNRILRSPRGCRTVWKKQVGFVTSRGRDSGCGSGIFVRRYGDLGGDFLFIERRSCDVILDGRCVVVNMGVVCIAVALAVEGNS